MRVDGLTARLCSTIRRITGMPDYGAYLTHMRDTHPAATPISEREFFAQHVQARYGDGPVRCC